MKKYIITIKAGGRAYFYGRIWDDHQKAAAMDTLEALFHLHLIDEFYIKEAWGDEDIHYIKVTEKMA